MYTHESKLQQSGFKRIAGLDEAGRGPLAGPVVAAAVILPHANIPGINDSKKLSPHQRECIFKDLLLEAEIGVGIVSAAAIDQINIFEATKLAMKRAVFALMQKPEFLLIDGKNMFLSIPIPQESIIRGDGLSASIAAASIVAKVTRDRIMQLYHDRFPVYNFARHKGYPTEEHVTRIDQNGPCPIHRRSFHPVKQWAEREMPHAR